jgi:hypothetical protein
VLAAAAGFGGPHGVWGALPWILNLPGILLVVGVPAERFVLARVACAFALQVYLWYVLVARVRRRRGRRRDTAG